MSDVATVMSIRRTTNAGSVLVGLESPGAFAGFEAWLTTHPALRLTAERQSDYYHRVAWSTSALISVVLEGVILSLLGALAGALLARILVDGKTEIIWNAVFTLSVSPGLIALGVGWALMLAILSGIFPAVRSARLPVAEALRQA